MSEEVQMVDYALGYERRFSRNRNTKKKKKARGGGGGRENLLDVAKLGDPLMQNMNNRTGLDHKEHTYRKRGKVQDC